MCEHAFAYRKHRRLPTRLRLDVKSAIPLVRALVILTQHEINP